MPQRSPTEGTVKDEWETPHELFVRLCKEFRFSRDVCATLKNAKLPDFWSENALSKHWSGTLWMNPPYSDPGPWVEKAHKASTRKGVTVVALLPVATETRYFQHFVLDMADEVRFLSKRLRFVGAPSGATLPNVVVVFRKHEGPTRYIKMEITREQAGRG